MRVKVLGAYFEGPFLKEDSTAQIITYNDDYAVLKLDVPEEVEGTSIEFAIASARSSENTISTLFDEGALLCNVVATTRERVESSEPFDLSWWRGGNAVITELRKINSAEGSASEK